jgi:hypothetical protein
VRYFHYDNSRFVSALSRRGFVVSRQARSPYSDSESNIAAELNMDYLSRFPHLLGARSQDVRPIKVVIEDNRAATLLKPLGYRYIHRDTDEVTFAAGNPHISPLSTPDSFMNLWLQNTALRTIGGSLGFTDAAADQRFRDSIHSSFSELDGIPRQPGPKFVVFHTLLPHDPYIFGASGQAVTFPSANEEDLGNRLGMRYYLHQVRFLEGRLLRTIDAIRTRSSTPPVIVLQSDEGFQATGDVVSERTMQDIRVKGLVALSMPGKKKGIANPPNTVNTLRLVFNRYFGTHYPMLRSASYPELDYPYQFEEMRVR